MFEVVQDWTPLRWLPFIQFRRVKWYGDDRLYMPEAAYRLNLQARSAVIHNHQER